MTDIALDNNYDLKIEDGDFVLQDATLQHQQLLLLIQKGELREFPTRGVGLLDWLLDDASGDLNSAIKREYEADGMTIDQVSVDPAGKINVKAYYE